VANYHFHVELIKRSAGQSVVDRAAYITKARLYDSYTGRIYDRRSCDARVLASGVYLPDKAPLDYGDIQKLLTGLNSAETRSNAQMARSYNLSLPVELTQEQQATLAKEFAEKHFTREGYCVIFAIHLKEASRSGRIGVSSLAPVNGLVENPHLHMIVPFRMIGSDGFQRTKIASRITNQPEYLGMLRKSWADMQNRTFARMGLDVRVSHESLSKQGIHRAPTPYLGVASLALERKGVQTDRGELYRSTVRQNAKLRGLSHSLERGHGPTR